VCPDTFHTKSAGCNSAEDRILIENQITRPQYIPYINLNIDGVTGDYMYDQDIKKTYDRSIELNDRLHTGGSGFGEQMSKFINQGGGCSRASDTGMDSEAARRCQYGQVFGNASQYRTLSGFY